MSRAQQNSPRGPVELFDDFLGDTINTDMYQTSADSGDTAFSVPATVIVDGAITGITDTTDNDMVEIGGALQWRAQDGTLVMEARLHSTVVSNVAITVGFNDDVLEDSNTLPVELATTTFTSNSSTFVGFVYDIDATNDNWHAFAVDDDNDTTVAIATLNTGVAPVASTYQTLRIEIEDTGSGNMATARFFINGALECTIPSAIDRDVLLAPHIAFENRAAAAHTVTVDYLNVFKDRG